MDERTNEIRKFWDDRAKEYGGDWRATLGEIYLRRLEIIKMTKLIKLYKPKRVLDVGCGNGYSTRIYANRFPKVEFVGIDYSSEMILQAKKSSIANCNFFVGDALYLNSLPDSVFDLIITQRCLQNIPDYERQRIAINNLLCKVSSNGTLLLMECSRDGVEQLNYLRSLIGMRPIADIEPWYNNFFKDKDLINDYCANVIHFTSTYMFLSRLIHPCLARMGYFLPAIGKFGYDKLYVINKNKKL